MPAPEPTIDVTPALPATLPPRDDAATIAPAVAPVPTSDRRHLGEYEIVREIARGGMGVVYEATQPGLKRPVAVKSILAGTQAGPDALARFHAEAQAAAQLRHPNIITIHAVGSERDVPYFAMDFIAGPSLADLVKDGPLPAAAAAELLAPVAEAIAHAHSRGILHRDLKPANVLLEFDTAMSLAEARAANFRGAVPKVTDFGLAKQLQGGSELTATGAILGTPSYMAPEQAGGKKEIGPTADVYGLGAILYHLLAGRPPFQGETPLDTVMLVLEQEPVPPRLLNPKIPAELEAVCLKCLEKNPARRYGSARALADDLGRFNRGEPVSVKAPNVPYLARTWYRQYFRTVFGAGLTGLVIGIGSWLLLEFGANPNGFAAVGLPDWLMVPVILTAFGLLLGVGYIAARILKPANKAADLTVGAAAGLVAALTAFVMFVGPHFLSRGQDLWLGVFRADLDAAVQYIENRDSGNEHITIARVSPADLKDVPEPQRLRVFLVQRFEDLSKHLHASPPTDLLVGLLLSLLLVPMGMTGAFFHGLYSPNRAEAFQFEWVKPFRYGFYLRVLGPILLFFALNEFLLLEMLPTMVAMVIMVVFVILWAIYVLMISEQFERSFRGGPMTCESPWPLLGWIALVGMGCWLTEFVDRPVRMFNALLIFFTIMVVVHYVLWFIKHRRLRAAAPVSPPPDLAP